MRVGLVEADENGRRTVLGAAPPCRRRVKAVAHVHEKAADDVAILRAAQPQGDVGFAPLEADRTNVGRNIEIECGMLGRQLREPGAQKTLREARQRIDSHEARRAAIAPVAHEPRGSRLHLACRAEHAGTARREHISVRPALHELFPERALERLNAPRYGRMGNGDCARRARQAAVPGQRDENADVFPIESCANLISH
ncbi:hypothetical protein Busp01_10500 [Trinickia caryophylli]|nr:hypothetical protein Busp01_10500 [Trinickia caryophylli]